MKLLVPEQHAKRRNRRPCGSFTTMDRDPSSSCSEGCCPNCFVLEAACGTLAQLTSMCRSTLKLRVVQRTPPSWSARYATPNSNRTTNDAGGPSAAALAVQDRFGTELDAARTALDDLVANFATPNAQGPRVYAEQMVTDHPDLDPRTLAADGVLAVEEFYRLLFAE